MMDNRQLLAEYASSGSDEAFGELTRRYVDLVYSTALRLVAGDTHRAEDVAQTVFLDLAAKASGLPSDVMLGGWLHRHTCFVAAKTMRGERRRLFREKQAVEMNALQNNPAPDLSAITPALDEAINELGDTDRAAIVLRFFEQRDFRSVGLALGSNEDAARMRVTRALEKLEALLKRRGISASAALLGLALITNVVQAAPVGLVPAITTAVALGKTTLAATAVKTAVMTTFQKITVTATLAIAIGAGVQQARRAMLLREELQTLTQAQSPLKDQLARLGREQEETARQLAILRAENEQLRKDRAELARLRGEASRWRNNAQELARLKAGEAADPTTSEAVSWKERVDLLRRHLEQNPAAAIGELRYLNENDWLTATSGRLETEKDYRVAASRLRQMAESRFAVLLQPALGKYLDANGNRFPTDLAQLQSYFPAPVDETILQRYAILPRETVSSLHMGGDWVITQRAAVDDDLDHRTGIGPNGWGTAGSQSWKPAVQDNAAKALEPAVWAYVAANGGKEPSTPEDLLPYLKTPEQKMAYEKAMKAVDTRTGVNPRP